MPDAAFELVADHRCRLIVLGSFPGRQSLAAGRYYANPRNQFWQLMSPVIGADLVSMSYRERLPALVDRGVGLWDVLETARRAGSLDSALRDAAPRDLQLLVRTLPQLRAMAFNGAIAWQTGQFQLSTPGAIELIALPSSSSANTVGLAIKQSQWSRLQRYLD